MRESVEQEGGWRVVVQWKGTPPPTGLQAGNAMIRSSDCRGRGGRHRGRAEAERQDHGVFVSFLPNDINDGLVLDEVRK